jgi:acyl dehydratase
MSARLYLEDLPLDEPLECGSFSLSRADIIAFARTFDPQPWHLDQALAEASAFGTLVASGLHSQAAGIRLLVDKFVDIAVLFGASLNETRFYVPVRPDVEHRVTARWTLARASASKPDQGVARVEAAAHNADGQLALTFGVTYIIARRPAA